MQCGELSPVSVPANQGPPVVQLPEPERALTMEDMTVTSLATTQEELDELLGKALIFGDVPFR